MVCNKCGNIVMKMNLLRRGLIAICLSTILLRNDVDGNRGVFATNMFPFYASVEKFIFDRWVPNHNGAVIAPKWVLVSNIAVGSSEYFSQRVLLGIIHDKYNWVEDPNRRIINVKRAVKYPVASPLEDERYFHTGLLELTEAIAFTNGMQPVHLPRNTQECTQTDEAMVIGLFTNAWWLKEIYPPLLQYLSVPIVSAQQCRDLSIASHMYVNMDRVICTTANEQGQFPFSSTESRSGLPLIKRRTSDNDTEVQFTIYGVLAETTHSYAVGGVARYTNVCAHLDWIRKTIDIP